MSTYIKNKNNAFVKVAGNYKGISSDNNGAISTTARSVDIRPLILNATDYSAPYNLSKATAIFCGNIIRLYLTWSSTSSSTTISVPLSDIALPPVDVLHTHGILECYDYSSSINKICSTVYKSVKDTNSNTYRTKVIGTNVYVSDDNILHLEAGSTGSSYEYCITYYTTDSSYNFDERYNYILSQLDHEQLLCFKYTERSGINYKPSFRLDVKQLEKLVHLRIHQNMQARVEGFVEIPLNELRLPLPDQSQFDEHTTKLQFNSLASGSPDSTLTTSSAASGSSPYGSSTTAIFVPGTSTSYPAYYITADSLIIPNTLYQNNMLQELFYFAK